MSGRRLVVVTLALLYAVVHARWPLGRGGVLAAAYLALGWERDGAVRFVADYAEEYSAVARGGRIAEVLLPPAS